MVETIKAWQCIGCGKVEATAQCIGVCQDRPVELVDAKDYRAALARIESLEEVVRRIALTSPKHGESERTWLALQASARRAMAQPAPDGETLASGGTTGQ